MNIKNTLLTSIAVFVLTIPLSGQDTLKSSGNSSKSNLQIDKKEITVILNDMDRIEKLLFKNEPSWFVTYGTMLVAIVALIGTVVASSLNNRRSRINNQLQLNANSANLSFQLDASQKNLLSQIKANREQELERQKLETESKMLYELRENIAKFINIATTLNESLNKISFELERFHDKNANEERENTNSLRQELTSLYYFLKVTLDGSDKQKQLERILDLYMEATCFNFDPMIKNPDGFQQLTSQLYDAIKGIIHENYHKPLEL